MQAWASGDPPREVEEIRAAARRSLAARGVRVYRATVIEDSGVMRKPCLWELGTADPAARSARVRSYIAENSPFWKLGEAAVRRWPWLAGDEPPPEPGPIRGEETIEIATKRHYGHDDEWRDWSEMPAYGPRRVLWPLEAILGMSSANQIGTAEVRGEQCVRYVGEARPGDVARTAESKLVDAPQPDDEWREAFAEVCIDATGLICRIAWTPKFRTRRRGGLLPRLAGLARSTSADPDDPERARAWEITEFWDYGCQTQINAPSELVENDDVSFAEIFRDVRRMRRDYKHQAVDRQPEGTR